jgi:DNA-directed RNA polymerase specialized sigma24 family protein
MSHGRATIVGGGGMNDSMLAMVAWLGSDDARAGARSDLRRLGLDWYDPDDLLHDVAVRLLQAELPDHVDNATGYARRAVQRRANDLLRGDLVRDRHRAFVPAYADEDDDRDPMGDVADPTAPDADVATDATEDAVRRALAMALATTKTWTVAAALNTLTLRVHPDVQLPDDAPRPDIDDADKADRWAALWLAGEVDVFATAADVDGPAVRKARSRKLQAVDQLLRAVAESILLEAGDDDA